MTDGIVEILLIEDNPNDAELIVRALKKNHLANRVLVLKDGAEALSFFFTEDGQMRQSDDQHPKIVLLDLKLPKVDGLEVLKHMRSHEGTKHIPVVMLTSSNQDRDIQAAYDLGVNSFVTKPIRFDDFTRVVNELGLYWLVLNVPPVE